MRNLLACTCLTPLALVSMFPAHAEVVIDTKTTAGISTATAKPAGADDIRIAAAGTVTPAGGIAVRLDSANSVKNDGLIQITGASDATGIHANAGMAGTITNTGKIIVDENYTVADADKDGDLDGPFAQGARRFGIRTAGAYTGAIVNSGTITIEGNDSAGIALEGPLTGSLTSSGAIDAIGDRSYGIRAGNVSGDVKLTGAIAAQGAGAIGVALDGNVGGAVVVQGSISSTGYRYTAAPADPSKLDADDLLQGGPALRIAGNVGGGILFDGPPKDKDPNDKDEDKDGIEDAKEGVAAITSYGSAAAVQIGSATTATTIGAVAGNTNGHGLVINGFLASNGVYKDVAAQGLVIGGLGAAVNIAGGLTLNGGVSTASNNGNATAISIGAGASVADIRAAGSITATGGGAATTQVRALSIAAGADVRTLTNSGKISAAAANDASAVAIVDKAGTLGLVENSGAISATSAKAGTDLAVALDLAGNAAGVTVRQTLVGTGVTAPSIVGNILFGSGNDVLDIADGSVKGITRFGAGNNRLALGGDAAYAGEVVFGAGADTLALAGTSTLAGKVDFGGGTDLLTIGGTARFNGELVGGAGLAVTLTGGSLDLTNMGAVQLASLNVGSTSAIGVNIDGQAGKFTQYQVGQAAFANGAKINVSLANVSKAEGSYVVVKAGTLTSGGTIAAGGTTLPFMFKSQVSANQATGEIKLDIARKSTTELGLNGSQSRAYDAIFKALDSDAPVAQAFLAKGDSASLQAAIQQMLPDHAGGAFDTVTQGSRATARFLADPQAPFADHGKWGYWLQQVAWGSSKGLGDTASYDVTGWGASGGAELKTGGAGNIGVSLAFLAGKDADDDNANEVSTDQYELAAYWRGGWNGVQANARVSAAHVGFEGSRRFEGMVGGQPVSRSTQGEWDGRLLSASAGLAYEMRFGRFSLRPAAAVDYYHLKEDGYAEAGGGKAFDLVVDGRRSDELAATGTLAAGLNFGGATPDAGWFRVEIDGGRRQIIGGSLGATTAHFSGGEDFTLAPENRSDGWVGKLRMIGGNGGFRIGGEFNAEEQQGRAAIAFRASLGLSL